jgi:phage/plasmid-like protein (TIGR03299 family)
MKENEMTTMTAEATRQMPWAGLTTNCVGNTESQDGVDSLTMLQGAGLDWDVAIRPLWIRKNSGEFVQHSKSREVYRTDNEQSLGTVKSRYETFSNREAFAFGDELVNNGDAHWVTAGQQNGGSRVFMTMEIGDGFRVLGEDDYKLFLFLRTSHGDGTSVSASIVPFRVWCLNQSQAVIRERVSTWAIPHTTTIKDRVEEARQSLRLTASYADEFQVLMERLAGVTVTDDKAKLLVGSMIDPNRSRRDAMIEGIMTTYQESATVEPYRGTGYGLLNGVTEYMDHVKRQNSANARFNSIMGGEGAKYRNEIIQNLLALAA